MVLSSYLIYSVCSALFFSIGVIGFLNSTDFLRKLLALNIIGMSVFMVLIAMAARDPANIDPLPHAMVLTGIVVAAAGTALALNLASKIVQYAQTIQQENEVAPADSSANSLNPQGATTATTATSATAGQTPKEAP